MNDEHVDTLLPLLMLLLFYQLIPFPSGYVVCTPSNKDLACKRVLDATSPQKLFVSYRYCLSEERFSSLPAFYFNSS